MEEQRIRTNGRRRQRRRSKNGKAKSTEPVLIAARRPDSPLLQTSGRQVVASAQPTANGQPERGAPLAGASSTASEATVDVRHDQEPTGTRRRAVRIVQVAADATGHNTREQQLLDRLVRSQGRGAISRAANDLLDGQFVPPKEQEVQIQLLEHEDERRAREAVFALAELLQREAPIKRPVMDQRLRRLEQSAEDPITRDAAGALRRSMRVHHGA